MLFRCSKKSSFSTISSEGGRSFISKSAIANHRAEKYLNHRYDRNLVDITNSFLKKSTTHKESVTKLTKKHM